MQVRSAAVAGSFYPADAAKLRAVVRDLLDLVPPVETQPPKLLVVPHAGLIYSGPVAATAYARLRAARGKISRVVMLGPSHRVAFEGIAQCGQGAYETPLGRISLDRDAHALIKDLPWVKTIDLAHRDEHALEVQLPFLQECLGAFSLAPLVAGMATPAQVAEVLARLWGGEETLVVISTDLSHYLEYGAGRALDTRTAKSILALDGMSLSDDQACGAVGLRGLLQLLKGRGQALDLLDLRSSGDTAGPRDRVVGYAAFALNQTPTMEAEEIIRQQGETLLFLAARSIRHGLDKDVSLPVMISDLPAELGQPAATFITLSQRGQLRGCIGSIAPRRPLAMDVVENAWRSASVDSRFARLGEDDLRTLSLSVSVLGRPVPLRFSDEAEAIAQLRPGVDGVLLAEDDRRSVFLPAVWDQLPNPGLFLAKLKQKAGLKAAHWSDRITLERFEASTAASTDLPDPGLVRRWLNGSASLS